MRMLRLRNGGIGVLGGISLAHGGFGQFSEVACGERWTTVLREQSSQSFQIVEEGEANAQSQQDGFDGFFGGLLACPEALCGEDEAGLEIGLGRA